MGARRIVVVGAGSGIGAAIAAHFHNLGFISSMTAGTPVQL
jgi:NAD(P)-dependent dehydrogenase (short-subunit alcohol dehydrogenase family)